MAEILSIGASAFFLLLICGTVLVILNGNADSGKKIAWILVIVIIPVVGLILYIVFGLDMRKPENFRNQHRTFLETFDRNCPESLALRLFGRKPEEKVRMNTASWRAFCRSDATPPWVMT